MDALIEKVKNIFYPPQESELSMMEFERLRQSVNMPITTYHARKVTAFHQAVPDAGKGQFKHLKREMTKGIYNQCVKMKVMEADNIENETDLLHVMVGAVANALQAYSPDTGGNY